MLQLPRCLVRTYNLDSYYSTLLELESFKKCNCSRKNRLQNSICFANVGCSPTPHQHFWKIVGSKNFWLPAARLRETTCVRFGKAGAHPQLAWESQLPLKPCISLQPLDFKGNCDSSDFLLDFCFVSRCSFNLLRKCGLLAHTSAAFLKNCCTEKLFVCLRLVYCNPISMLLSCHVMFHVKHCF